MRGEPVGLDDDLRTSRQGALGLLGGSFVERLPLGRDREDERRRWRPEVQRAAGAAAVVAARIVTVLAPEVLGEVIGPYLVDEELLAGPAGVDVGRRRAQIDRVASGQQGEEAQRAEHRQRES